MGDAPYLALLDDLAAEEDALDTVVAAIDDDRAAGATAAPGWDVRDTIDHLAGAEALAAAAITAPGSFAELLGTRRREPAEAPTWTDVLDRWRVERRRVLAGLRAAGARDRFPWVAGEMSAMSFATARLMETWAHGVDVATALGVAYPETARLRHVADLGVRTRAFAFANHGLAPPETDVRVVLVGPEGQPWTWGESDTDVVRGIALDFCLVVTQRRHVDDSALTIAGAVAHQWMVIAQSFAGAPTTARRA